MKIINFIKGDGIYDKLSTKEVVDIVWTSTKENLGDNIHQVCATAVEQIMKTAIAKRTVDNITVVMIAFSSFKNFLFPKRADLIGHNSLDNIDMGRKQYIFDNSLIGNNSFDLDNRSFSLGEELNIVNIDSKNKFIDLNSSNNNLSKNNSTNTKTLLNKRANILKKKPVAGIGIINSAKNQITGNTNNVLSDKSKINNNFNNLNKLSTNKPSFGLKKPDTVHTSRGLTKNMETFYKKK